MGIKKKPGHVLIQVNVPKKLHTHLKLKKIHEENDEDESNHGTLGEMLIELAEKGKRFEELEDKH